MAHPRVGGENDLVDMYYSGQSGSSPRGRGKRARDIARINQQRLIPAWAGKTHEAAHVQVIDGAHPRVGGENAARSNVSGVTCGSSPRGRGKLRR